MTYERLIYLQITEAAVRRCSLKFRFPVNIAKFLVTRFFTEHLRWMLLRLELVSLPLYLTKWLFLAA